MFNGYRASAGENETVLETDGGDGCTEMWMHLMTLNGMVKMVSCMLCIFYHNKTEINI